MPNHSFCHAKDRFKRLKRYVHMYDNRKLDPNDKFDKITLLNLLMNKKFMQFGMFAHNLSIDELISDDIHARCSSKGSQFGSVSNIEIYARPMDICLRSFYMVAPVPYQIQNGLATVWVKE